SVKKRIQESQSFITMHLFFMVISAILIYQRNFLFLVIIIAWIYFARTEQKKKRFVENQIQHYIETTTHLSQSLSHRAVINIPVGILVYSDEFTIQSFNPYLQKMFQEQLKINASLFDLDRKIIQYIKEERKGDIVWNDKVYEIMPFRPDHMLFVFDITEEKQLEKKYNDRKVAFAYIYLDNYDDITQSVEDQVRSQLNNTVTSLLNTWAQQYGLFIKRSASDRFFAIINRSQLKELEAAKFNILDIIREETARLGLTVTISMGISEGAADFIDLGKNAQSALDLALGRGGDQVAVRTRDGKMVFYGGKTNPVEKRTKVRARIISHAVRDLMANSSQVFIMGHKHPDMDAIGAAIGMAKMAYVTQKRAHIIIDANDLDIGVARFYKDVQTKHPDLAKVFISPEKALELVDDKTLLVVVDTHRPSMLISNELLEKIDQVVVIDHHRRSEDFIHPTVLVYMEPYASSTAELVTELLEYQGSNITLSNFEATSLLAGIILDTKSFTLRTGSRTFEAASYLRLKGADTVYIQNLMKSDRDDYLKRAELIRKAYFPFPGIAVTHTHEILNQVLIAQTADTLLTMNDVQASFVIAKKSEQKVGISARSLGEINVQIIMERLNGGGHLTNAATQVDNKTIEQLEAELIGIIHEELEGRQ
ncbi:MAG: DHH family phosphoesterase, partial [Bacilli bacterium]